MNLVGSGRAFLVSGTRFNPAPHLWLVLTDPSPPDHRVVAVMVVTSRQHTDKTIVLRVGDHPFIRHESNVDFGGAILVHVNRFESALQAGKCHPQPDMTASILQRMREGLLASPRTVNWLAAHCRRLFE